MSPRWVLMARLKMFRIEKITKQHGGLESPSRVEVRHLPAPLPRGVGIPPREGPAGGSAGLQRGAPEDPPS